MKKILLFLLIVTTLIFSACADSNADKEVTDNIDSKVIDDTEVVDVQDDITSLDATLACNKFIGSIIEIEEKDGKTYFVLYERESGEYFNFVVSQGELFDNSQLVDDFIYEDSVIVYSFSSQTTDNGDLYLAHIVIVEEPTRTFYAIVADVNPDTGRLILKGCDFNEVNSRGYYIVDVDEASIVRPYYMNLTAGDFKVGDLVMVRGRVSTLEVSPQSFDRFEEIELLVQGYDPDFVYDDF